MFGSRERIRRRFREDLMDDVFDRVVTSVNGFHALAGGEKVLTQLKQLFRSLEKHRETFYARIVFCW